jgi:hypothetical protein
MDAANTQAAPKGSTTGVLKALKAPFRGVGGMLQHRAAKAEAKQHAKHVAAQAVEMHDFSSCASPSSSSLHRKTDSDSSVATTTTSDSQNEQQGL